MGGNGKLNPATAGQIELTIDHLGEDAAGRATYRAPGRRPRRFRVPGTLPGERVQGEIVFGSKTGLSVAYPTEIIEASGDRIEARCPHAVACGGCDLLHARLSAQHRFKREAIARCLGIPLQDVEPVVPSPRSHGYRALAKLVVGPNRTLGSYRPRGHTVQDMAGCRVHAPEVEAIADATRAWLRRATGGVDLRYLLIRGSLAEGRAIVVLVSRRPAATSLRRLAEHLAERPDVAQVFVHMNDSGGGALLTRGPMDRLHDKGPVFEQLGPVRQMLSPKGFSQVNPLAAAELYRRVVDELRPAGHTFVDLYAGSGGVSLSLVAAGARHVTAVERDPQAVAAAREAAVFGGMGDRLTVIEGEVHEVIGQFRGVRVDGVVLNPPRKGAGPEVMAGLAALGYERLVYVSCNPASLARDLGDTSLSVTRVTPVDLFPHTRHIETLLVATRRPAL